MIGVCQSGDYPFVINSVRPDIVANVAVYGGAMARCWDVDQDRPEPYDDIVGRSTAPLLGIWGERDFLITVDDVLRLRATLERNRRSYEFKLFRDMPHGWMNFTMPGRYRPAESAAAFELIVDFLDRVDAGAFPADRARWRFEFDIAVTYDPATNHRV
jgi:carboxymethylenebutenolidase